jgi:hypothetical protein
MVPHWCIQYEPDEDSESLSDELLAAFPLGCLLVVMFVFAFGSLIPPPSSSRILTSVWNSGYAAKRTANSPRSAIVQVERKIKKGR